MVLLFCNRAKYTIVGRVESLVVVESKEKENGIVLTIMRAKKRAFYLRKKGKRK